MGLSSIILFYLSFTVFGVIKWTLCTRVAILYPDAFVDQLHASVKTFVAFSVFLGPDVTLKISTLSFFAVLLRRPK